MSLYTAQVTRKNDRWYARVSDGARIEAGSEEDLREGVRAHLLRDVVAREGGCEDDYDAKMARTWRIRVTRATTTEDNGDDDFAPFDLFG